MKRYDHLAHAIIFGGFAVICFISCVLLAALGEAYGCIISAVLAVLCGSRSGHEMAEARR